MKSTQPAKKKLASNWTNWDQIVASGSLIALAATLHLAIPSLRPQLEYFYTLSYRVRDGVYVQGAHDTFFLLGSLVGLTFLRATFIAIVEQLALRFLPLAKGKDCLRFGEQAWLLVYDSTSFTLGMIMLKASPYWMNFSQIWAAWPSREMNGDLKAYFLIQLAFWLQQIFVLNVEAKRKDYSQMFTHHIITSSLMYICYAYRFTRVGHIFLCIMDVVDFLLPAAKLFKYMKFEALCNLMFGIFLLAWIIARHVVYNIVWYRTSQEIFNIITPGCYDSSESRIGQADNLTVSQYIAPFFDQSSPICFNDNVLTGFLALLGGIQALSILWFGLILRVLWGIIRGKNAEDVRSDDEEDEEAEIEAGEDNSKAGSGLVAHVELGSREKEIRLPSTAQPTIVDTSSVAETRTSHKLQYFSENSSRIKIPGPKKRQELTRRVGCSQTDM